MIVAHCPICGGRAELRALQAHYDAECVACEWWFVVPELAAARRALASKPYATLVDLFSMRLLPAPASCSLQSCSAADGSPCELARDAVEILTDIGRVLRCCVHHAALLLATRPGFALNTRCDAGLEAWLRSSSYHYEQLAMRSPFHHATTLRAYARGVSRR